MIVRIRGYFSNVKGLDIITFPLQACFSQFKQIPRRGGKVKLCTYQQVVTAQALIYCVLVGNRFVLIDGRLVAQANAARLCGRHEEHVSHEQAFGKWSNIVAKPQAFRVPQLLIQSKSPLICFTNHRFELQTCGEKEGKKKTTKDFCQKLIGHAFRQIHVNQSPLGTLCSQVKDPSGGPPCVGHREKGLLLS